jgi:hypothetical protein
MQLILFAFIAALLGGCDSLTKLRAFLRGEEASLQVEVTPKTGITILLDGQEVAQSSPFAVTGLTAGSHLLEVRAQGYHPFRLPLVLKEGEQLTVPVALRKGAPSKAPVPEPKEPPANPPSPAPPLPYGVAPITLILAAEPEQPLLLDELPTAGRQIKLERTHGTLGAGPLLLKYRLGGAGLLELTVPDETAEWRRDGAILLPGNSFRLHNGVVRVTRIATDGSGQTLLIRR